MWGRRDACLLVSSRRTYSSQTFWYHQKVPVPSWACDYTNKRLSCIQHGGMRNLKPGCLFLLLAASAGWQRHRSDDNIYSSLTLRSKEKSHNNHKWSCFSTEDSGVCCKETQKGNDKSPSTNQNTSVFSLLCPPGTCVMGQVSVTGRKSPNYRNLKLWIHFKS